MVSKQSLLCVGSFAINDVVHANGDTEMNVPAGNALYSTLGGLHTAPGVSVAAMVGQDWKNSALSSLEAMGADCSLVRPHDGSSLRAWVVYENSCDRRYLLRSPEIISLTPNPLAPPPRKEEATMFESVARELHSINCPRPNDIERLLSQFSGIHICPMPLDIVRQWVRSIRRTSDALISLDPPPISSDVHKLEEVLAEVDIFIPSEAEANTMYPHLSPEAFLLKMRDMGIPQCVLKLGEQGCIGFTDRTSDILRVPAYTDGETVDTTGAGDVFCGAFLGCYLKRKELREAMCKASAVASMYTESFDPFAAQQYSSSELAHRFATVSEAL
ncbi:MAG: carbohydrate kinase family protein [Myxococcota bacterium]|nr:carbohydrate kinase family protein [Myxococcota bacterium]